MKNQRFSYVKFDATAHAKQETLRMKFEDIENFVTSNLQLGRAQSLVFTKIEEAYLWAGKAIRDEQIAKLGEVEHVTKRTNE